MVPIAPPSTVFPSFRTFWAATFHRLTQLSWPARLQDAQRSIHYQVSFVLWGAANSLSSNTNCSSYQPHNGYKPFNASLPSKVHDWKHTAGVKLTALHGSHKFQMYGGLSEHYVKCELIKHSWLQHEETNRSMISTWSLGVRWMKGTEKNHDIEAVPLLFQL